MRGNKKINVVRTPLPSLDDYIPLLQKIWDSGWITNNGSHIQELEDKIRRFLFVDHLYAVANGTVALQLAIRALDLKDQEVITTPFSYVATLNALLWEGAIPVMADINPATFQIDPEEIRKKINKRTKAILAVHVYGYPAPTEAIQAIADEYNLKVIYDAAHAFGTRCDNKSLSQFGDITCYSFHATKPFHTVEGGAVVVKDSQLGKKIDNSRHFGHRGDEYFGLGINAKMSELHAAIGILSLKSFDSLVQKRREVWHLYKELLCDWENINGLTLNDQIDYNYSYYPIVFESENHLLSTFQALNKKEIFPRRYFYPSLSQLPHFKVTGCPIAVDISSRVACLPLYDSLPLQKVREIAGIIEES